MLFSKGDISLTNVLFELNTDISVLKKQETIKNSKDKIDTLSEYEDVQLSEMVYNKSYDENFEIEDKQKIFNLLEKDKQSSVIIYDYLQEMKNLLKENVRKTREKTEKDFDELTISVNEIAKKIDETSDILTPESLGLVKDGSFSIKNKKDAESLLKEVNKAEKALESKIDESSEKKDKIEKDLENFISKKPSDDSENNKDSIIALVKIVKSSLIDDSVNGIKTQIKNINEKSSLPLLGL